MEKPAFENAIVGSRSKKCALCDVILLQQRSQPLVRCSHRLGRSRWGEAAEFAGGDLTCAEALAEVCPSRGVLIRDNIGPCWNREQKGLGVGPASYP